MFAVFEGPGHWFGSVALRYEPAIVERVWLERRTPRRPYPPVAGKPAVALDDEPHVGDQALARPPALARLEAVLLLSREPVASRKLAALAGLADGTEARTLVRTLNRLYDTEGRAFRAAEVAGGYLLLTRAKFAPWLRRLHGAQAEVRLSAPAMETLAVVAYRQPVLRAEIEAIRGVQCGEILRQLMDRGLVRIAGRSEDLGRPFLYGTTRLFLQVFGLRHLDELPQVGQLKQPVHSVATEGESNVRTAVANKDILDDAVACKAATTDWCQRGDKIDGDDRQVAIRCAEEDDDLDDEDLDDEDFEDEDLDEEEEEEEEDLDDEDFEDDEWEEVDDEDVDEDEGEEEEEEEEDEDWDDEDWDDDEDEDDWDDDEDEDEDWE
ncbi:MAG: SMC-Scp complex subunit ScpB [Thermoguttaceae bacterium]|jgi:segregation and condensation protein B|nr:SMC-Scp complex subunit ScpB [Thermoguttaceae bacterium]